jgi:hypothetical protein
MVTANLVEAHYEEVEWCGSIRASALIGALVDDF